MAGMVAGGHRQRELSRLGGPWRQAEAEETGVMESAAAWSSGRAQRLAWRKGH